jgi:hypothetical protein
MKNKYFIYYLICFFQGEKVMKKNYENPVLDIIVIDDKEIETGASNVVSWWGEDPLLDA